MRATLFALATVAIIVPVSARESSVPVATAAGRPIDCVRLTDIRETHVRSDSVIDFEMSGKRFYRNTLPNSCPQLGFEERFSYSVSNGELCAVDTITVLESTGVRGATCGLGQFQPVTMSK